MISGSRCGSTSDITAITSHISISLDGFVAAPHQSATAPIGEGGMRLHEWAFATRAWNVQQGRAGGADGPDSDVAARLTDRDRGLRDGPQHVRPGPRGLGPSLARVVGRGSPVPHAGVRAHPSSPRAAGHGRRTTFHFITDGIGAALDAAVAATGGEDVMVAGGASAIQQTITAGRLDELHLHVVSVILGAGERLLANVGDPVLQPIEVVASAAVTHIRYRVG